MSRMTKAIDNLSNVSMNTKESRGRITDADFALESANLNKKSNFTTISNSNDCSSK